MEQECYKENKRPAQLSEESGTVSQLRDCSLTNAQVLDLLFIVSGCTI